MAKTIVEQIVAAHLVSGELAPGAEVALKIDHTLTQDATGTLAYLEFEATDVVDQRTLGDQRHQAQPGRGRARPEDVARDRRGAPIYVTAYR